MALGFVWYAARMRTRVVRALHRFVLTCWRCSPKTTAPTHNLVHLYSGTIIQSTPGSKATLTPLLHSSVCDSVCEQVFPFPANRAQIVPIKDLDITLLSILIQHNDRSTVRVTLYG
uniref:Putative secreted peptide n=1 Tax=Anopheles braziliensis TaxID=58242 RepID=A0A2M3ZQP4_9DIPT